MPDFNDLSAFSFSTLSPAAAIAAPPSAPTAIPAIPMPLSATLPALRPTDPTFLPTLAAFNAADLSLLSRCNKLFILVCNSTAF